MGYPRTVPPKSNSAPKSQSQSRSDPLASSCNLTDPIFSANSFPKFTDLFCRLFLPTLLYWPEAAHLGDLLWLWVWRRENQSFPRIFKGLQECTRHQKKCGALLTMNLSPGNQILWCQVVNKKRELFPGLLLMSPSSVALPQIWTKRPRISGPKGPEYPRSGLGILTQFPFDKWPMIGHFETKFSYLLGLTNPYPTAVLMESFSTSIFKVLIWIFATTTKICTRGRFTQAHANHHDLQCPPTRQSFPISSDG